MSELEPITREEVLLDSVANGTPSNLTPITRQEIYLSAIAGESDLPEGMEPITREEEYYQMILDNGGAGGGGEATGTKTINITANGTTSHNVKAYATAQIITNVPNPSTGTKQITANGSHDVTDYASAQVDVPNSYSASDEGKVVSNGALVSQTSRSVTSNGTIDTTLNNSVEINVPQGITPTGTKNITTNGDHDVTNFAMAHVDVPTGITPSGSQTYTQNGTYDVTNLAEAVVNVQASGGSVLKAEGTVELATKGSFPTITHNLGTSKVAVIIFPLSKISYTTGYLPQLYIAMNARQVCIDAGLEKFEWDYTAYNSHFSETTEVDIETGANFAIGSSMRSPWSTQNNYSVASAVIGLTNTIPATVFTDYTVSTSTQQFEAGTYKWIVWAL